MPDLLSCAGRLYRPVLFFVLWLLCLCSEAYCQQPLRIEQGVLDLRNVSMTGRSLYLEGEVDFYWQKLIGPQEGGRGISPSITSSGFPETWNGKVVGEDALGANGFATYAFDIWLPRGSIGEKYGLYIQDMYSSYRLYVNGREVSSNGQVGENKASYTPYWLPRLATFYAKSDTLRFLLQIANFDHSKGGISEAMLFGDAKVVEADFRNDLAYDYILSGSLLMGGLFFLGLFFFGRDKHSILYFSLFCLLFSYRVIGSVDYGLHHMFPAMTWAVSIRIEYLNLFAIAFFFVRYTRHLYPDETSRRVIWFFSAASFLMFAVTTVLPIRLFTQLPPVFFGLYLLFVPYCLWVYVQAIRNKRQGAMFALLSVIVMLFSYGLEAMDYFQVAYRQNLLFFISMSAFFFLQSLILSYRFAMSYKSAMYRAQEASQAKSDFLSVMSHEIRTPLNAVVGMSHLLEAKGTQRENVTTLKTAAQNLLLLVNNILDFTKIDAGKVTFEALDTNLRDLLEKLRLMHQTQALEDGLRLEVIVDEAVPETVICDPTRLTQVLSNLVSNGLKFTHKGAVQVRLSTVETDTASVKIRFAVTDTGIGIAPDKQKLIFDTFTQAARSTTRNYGGTGLGLSIIRKLLELQGCTLHLLSEEGVGSTFWFEQVFEIGMAREAEPAKVTDTDQQELLRGKRILLVEDNPVNVVIARKFLERWQTEVVVAMNGQEALKQKIDFDLILMDLQMPDIDGYTITKMLRARGVTIPILAFTASALFDARKKILDSGMDDYVMKPFDPEELYQKLIKQLS